MEWEFVKGDYKGYLANPNSYFIDPIIVFWFCLTAMWMYCEIFVGFVTFSQGIFIYYTSNYLYSLDTDPNSMLY